MIFSLRTTARATPGVSFHSEKIASIAAGSGSFARATPAKVASKATRVKPIARKVRFRPHMLIDRSEFMICRRLLLTRSPVVEFRGAENDANPKMEDGF